MIRGYNEHDLVERAAMTRPFDHLEERNLIEYKSIHQVLNEKTFGHLSGNFSHHPNSAKILLYFQFIT